MIEKLILSALRQLCRIKNRDYVPIFEMGIEPEIKKQFMGQTLVGHEDEIAFYRRAGYDAYPVSLSVLNYKAADDPKDLGQATTMQITTQSMQKATLEAYNGTPLG